jgi:hypothetical protein
MLISCQITVIVSNKIMPQPHQQQRPTRASPCRT